jgi:hypothetical protein
MIEAILDHLHDNKKSLRACSLVCKNWIHPARRLLFSRWTMDLYRAEIDWSLRISTALPFLRHIYINSYDGRQDWDANLPLLVEPNHVQSLHLFCPFGFLAVRASSTLLHNLSGVVNLRLEWITFNDVPTLVGFVCGFPHLQTLSIKGGTIRRFEFDTSSLTMFQPSPHLVALELGIFGLDKILEWFLTIAVLPRFRSISLDNHPTIDVVVMQRFIATLDDSLEHLSLPIYSAHTRSLLAYTSN